MKEYIAVVYWKDGGDEDMVIDAPNADKAAAEAWRRCGKWSIEQITVRLENGKDRHTYTDIQEGGNAFTYKTKW